MTIKINLDEMTHLKEKSHYNYNFYSYGNMGLELLQKWNEEYDSGDYYLIDGDSRVFLGSSDSDESEIEFMYMYT